MKRFLYILKLENDYYYVGITEDIDHRYNSHASGNRKKQTKSI
jgi:predicted GIY-YIG superfamily endonuclease